AVALSAYFVIVLPDLSDQPLRFLVVLPALGVLALVHPRVLRRLSDVVLRRLGQAPLPTMLPPRRIAAIVAMYIATLLAAGAGVAARLVQTLVELIYTGGAWLLAGRAGLAVPRPAEGETPSPQWAARDSNPEPRA